MRWKCLLKSRRRWTEQIQSSTSSTSPTSQQLPIRNTLMNSIHKIHTSILYTTLYIQQHTSKRGLAANSRHSHLKLENVAKAKFYCLHAVADCKWHIWIRVECQSSPQQCFNLTLTISVPHAALYMESHNYQQWCHQDMVRGGTGATRLLSQNTQCWTGSHYTL